MGHTYSEITVRGEEELKIKDVLVDTGATFTVLPLSVLESIRATKSPYVVKLQLGDRRRVSAAIYLAEIKINGRKGPARIAAFKRAVPTIGVDTLETLGLKVNPNTGKLETTRGKYLLFVSMHLAN